MPTSAPSAVDLALLLGQASHALTTELTAAMVDVGISPRAHCVLSKAMTGELTQSQLAELCDLDKTTMVVTIDELEKAGLAERRPSPSDRRARVIAVTDAGARLVRDAQRIVSRVYDDVLGSLPARDRDAFVRALEQLVAGRLRTPATCDRIVRRPGQRANSS